MRLVCAGTPEVALPSLERLAGAGHDVVAVLTRAPAARGRSGRPVPSPVGEWARQRGIEALTPRSPRDPELAGRLADLAPDCCPVIAYGGLLPKALLDQPPYGWINLHFSLLPAYRGAAPVQHAILGGDTTTGATTFRIVEALDAGPIWRQRAVPLGARASTGEVLAQLADLGADLLVESVAAAAAGETPRPQMAGPVTVAPKITVAAVRIDWRAPVEAVDRLVRAAVGWRLAGQPTPEPHPGAWTVLAGRRLKIVVAEPTDERAEPGRVIIRRREVLVGTGTRALRLLWVIPEGHKPMPAPDWARGLRIADPVAESVGAPA
jgi:methionyl-tRNA formyltransferase